MGKEEDRKLSIMKQHKQRDPFFTEMLKKKKGAHKNKKAYTRKVKHKKG